jgi:hypothetical protein
MEMPWGMARRTPSRALTQTGDPSAEVPAPAARPGRRRRADSRAEAILAQCTAWHKIPFRMSWHSVRPFGLGQRMAWSKSVWLRDAPLLRCTTGALRGQHDQAETVLEAGLDLSALKLESLLVHYMTIS